MADAIHNGGIRKRYHGYYEHEYGEQAVFVYDYEVNESSTTFPPLA